MLSTVTGRDVRLGAGLLLFAIGVGLTELRMAGVWSKAVLLLIVLVAFVAMLALLYAQEPTDEPAPLTSLLCALAFVFGALTVYRFGTVFETHGTLRHAGTLTWMGVVVTGLGAFLGGRRRSAALVLVALIVLSLTTFAAVDWLFGVHRHVNTYHYVALILAFLYMFAATWVTEWERLASVLYVTAGLLLFAIAETIFGLPALAGGHGVLLGIPLFLVGALPKPPWGWALMILIGGLLLAAAATRRRDPGPGYIAGLILVAWVSLVAAPLQNGTVLGWPLIAVIVGGLAIAIAVTDTRTNRFDLARSPELLAAGALALGLGILLTMLRMDGAWSRGVLLAIAVGGFALTAAAALAQPRAGDDDPSGPTSLLSVLTVAYAVLVLQRLADVLSVHSPLSHAGTITWVAAGAAVVGAGLVYNRRSAGVGLVTIVLGATAVVAGSQWLFHVLHHLHAISYILVGLALAYLALAWVSLARWRRLATVAAVSAGVAVGVAAAILVYAQLTYLINTQLPAAQFVKQHPPAIGAGWMAVTLLGVLVMAGAAALTGREAGPGYAAAILAVILIELDVRRSIGATASIVAWPLVLLVVGLLLTLSAPVALPTGPRGDPETAPA